MPPNNLPAERVLFAFAKPAGEDYPFRLIKPGMAVSGRRFAVVAIASFPVKTHRRGTRTTMIIGIALPQDDEIVPVVLWRMGIAM